jgi:DNA-directed RNA polymerase subunit RPC12/RpoP
MKIIKCEACGHKIMSEEDIVYIEDQTAYYDVHLVNNEILYDQKDSESWEFGQYVCASCYSELPIGTEMEMLEYLKFLKSRRGNGKQNKR